MKKRITKSLLWDIFNLCRIVFNISLKIANTMNKIRTWAMSNIENL